MKIRATIFGFLIALACFALVRCNKLVAVPPPINSITSENIFSNDNSATSVLTGIYTQMSGSPIVNGGQVTSLSLICGLSADEFTLYGGNTNSNTNLVLYYYDNLSPNILGANGNTWTDFYQKIYTANLAYERISNSTSLTSEVKMQLMGEALFIRSFCYFYLINLFGDVPLVITSDYQANSKLSRTNSSQIYARIIQDLRSAETLLSNSYVGSDAKSLTQERVRPNKWAAAALLARCYLFNKQYDSAENEASKVIQNSALYDTVSLDKTFLKNSREAIWQLQPVITGWNTVDAQMFVLPSSGPSISATIEGNHPVYLSAEFVNSFEKGDNRRISWIDSVNVNGNIYYFPYKYRSAKLNDPLSEYLMVLRLSEQYFIRAEARANQNNLPQAINDINIIRAKARLSALSPANLSLNDFMIILEHERQGELGTEWGNRWLDLKRWNKIDSTMEKVAIVKSSQWNSFAQLYPLPSSDVILDPSLLQNPGY